MAAVITSYSIHYTKLYDYESHPLVRRALRANLLGWHVELFNSGSLEQVTEIARGGVTGGQPFDLLVVGLSRDECEEPVLQELHASLRAVFPGPILLLVGATRITSYNVCYTKLLRIGRDSVCFHSSDALAKMD